MKTLLIVYHSLTGGTRLARKLLTIVRDDNVCRPFDGNLKSAQKCFSNKFLLAP